MTELADRNRIMEARIEALGTLVERLSQEIDVMKANHANQRGTSYDWTRGMDTPEIHPTSRTS